MSISQCLVRLDFLISSIESTSLKKFFKSIKINFLIFVLIDDTNISIYSLCKNINIDLKKYLFDLCIFLKSNFDNSELIDQWFISKQALSLDWNCSINDLFTDKNLQAEPIKNQVNFNELIMTKEIISLNNSLIEEFAPTNISNKLFIDGLIFKNYRFLVEGILLVIVFLTISLLLFKFNKHFEQVLTQKIEIFEPQFNWLKKSTTFKNDSIKSLTSIVKPRQFKEINKKSIFGKVEYNNWTNTESETTLASLDVLPQDIDDSNYEISKYEESKKRGYRDSRFGATKVYRVIINSSNLPPVLSSLKNILSLYNVSKVDNVAPGQSVPGGNYYNIFVPRSYLKEFLSKVMHLGESFLYESRTRTTRNPAGKNKVFIWVKNI